ncbi:restriction endonuclease subunit S [Deinococcus wulumuqiensis]
MSQEKGNVPEGWEEKPLGETIELISGQHVEAAFCNDVGDGSPYLTGPSDFIDGRVKVTKYTTSPKKFSAPNDILLTVKGSGTGRMALSDDIYAISRQLMAVRAKCIDSSFLWHSLLPFESQFNEAANGLIPGISREDVTSIPLLLPPLPEQRKIAAILSTWDDSLSTLARLLDAKRQQKRGLAEALLTGKTRLKGFAGEWEETELSHVIRESRVPAEDELGKRLTVSLHLRGVSVRDERDNSEVGKTIYYRRKAGQFIYGKQNIFRGSMGIVPDKLDGYLSSQDLPAFDVASGFSVHYLYEYFARAGFYEGLEKIATGTGSKRVHPETLYKLRIPFPPLPEQQAIASILSTLDAEIASLEALRGKVQEQKRGLMDELLTGRVRVKVEETC